MKKLSILLLPLFSLLFTACVDEESILGIDLVDSTTLYNGKQQILYADAAWTEPEDSLLSSNYSFGAIGNYHDAVFGKVSAILYTQIALPSNTSDIAFDSAMVIDSVVLTLAKTQLFPDTGGSYNFRFEVMQLAEPLLSDTSYYGNQSIPVDNNAKFYDAVVPVGYTDSVITLLLDTSINSVLRRSVTAEQFLEQTKGLRVKIKEQGSDEGMVSIDFSSSLTCLRAHYHYISSTGDTTKGFYTFLMGAGTSHFIQFSHDYSGTLFASGNHLAGIYRLYLEPFGGHRVRMSFNRDIAAFHEAHPWAVIHHAELVMPVAPESSNLKPDQILTLGKDDSGEDAYIDDLLDIYTLKGYDGTYNEAKNHYRMRITQHLQGLLRKGNDPGMLLLLNSRRHAAQRTVLYGIGVADTNNQPHIVITYTE